MKVESRKMIISIIIGFHLSAKIQVWMPQFQRRNSLLHFNEVISKKDGASQFELMIIKRTISQNNDFLPFLFHHHTYSFDWPVLSWQKWHARGELRHFLGYYIVFYYGGWKSNGESKPKFKSLAKEISWESGVSIKVYWFVIFLRYVLMNGVLRCAPISGKLKRIM